MILKYLILKSRRYFQGIKTVRGKEESLVKINEYASQLFFFGYKSGCLANGPEFSFKFSEAVPESGFVLG